MAEIQVCAFHADEGIRPVPLGDEAGSWQYTCSRLHGHPTDGPFTWVWVPEPPHLQGLSGVASELNLHVELPSVLAEHRGTWVEYGVVEHGYAQRNPRDFAMLVERYGHTAIKGKPYTVSAFLAKTLGDLSRYGSVLYHDGPATGRWSYNSRISWWTLPPDPEWSTASSWQALGCTVAYVPGQTEIQPLPDANDKETAAPQEAAGRTPNKTLLPFTRRVRCSICGKTATTVKLEATQDDTTSPFRFVYEGIEAGTGPSGTLMGAEEAALVAQAFTEPLTYPAVHEVGLYDDAGFCAECKEPYCFEHWNVSTTGGGRCPQGHFQSLDPHWSPDFD